MKNAIPPPPEGGGPLAEKTMDNNYWNEFLDKKPDDWETRLIYSDWLEEHGREKEASFQRKLVSLKIYPFKDRDDWGWNIVGGGQDKHALPEEVSWVLGSNHFPYKTRADAEAVVMAIMHGRTIINSTSWRTRIDSHHLRRNNWDLVRMGLDRVVYVLARMKGTEPPMVNHDLIYEFSRQLSNIFSELNIHEAFTSARFPRLDLLTNHTPKGNLIFTLRGSTKNKTVHEDGFFVYYNRIDEPVFKVEFRA